MSSLASGPVVNYVKYITSASCDQPRGSPPRLDELGACWGVARRQTRTGNLAGQAPPGPLQHAPAFCRAFTRGQIAVFIRRPEQTQDVAVERIEA